MNAERKHLDDGLGRIVQYDWMDEETLFWIDRNHTNSSSLQYSLLMQNLQELEQSLAGEDLKVLEYDILVHIEQLGALRSFGESMSMATLDTLTHESDSSLLHKIIRFDPETPLEEEEEEEEDIQVVVRSGRSQERKLKRMKASEKGSRISEKVNPRKPRKTRKSSSSQFISEWKSYPGRRRSIVREQSALLQTIKVLLVTRIMFSEIKQHCYGLIFTGGLQQQSRQCHILMFPMFLLARAGMCKP